MRNPMKKLVIHQTITHQRGDEVTLKYRATNSFGAKVLEQVSGDVYFTDNQVSIRNVQTD